MLLLFLHWIPGSYRCENVVNLYWGRQTYVTLPRGEQNATAPSLWYLKNSQKCYIGRGRGGCQNIWNLRYVRLNDPLYNYCFLLERMNCLKTTFLSNPIHLF